MSLIERLVSVLDSWDIYIDIGSSTGILTEAILKKLDKKGITLSKVVLFEPVPRYFSECLKRFKNNPICTVENIAISDDTDDKVMYVSKINNMYNKIYRKGMEIHPHYKFVTKCTTLSSYLVEKNINRVKLIKIDAEGHDVNILSGMLDFLSRTDKLPFIQYEGNWYPEEESRVLNKIVDKYNYSYKVYRTDFFLIPPQNKVLF